MDDYDDWSSSPASDLETHERDELARDGEGEEEGDGDESDTD